MHRAGTKAGFTLLEMLVVLVLIGVLTGVAVLSLPGDPQRQARQEAERLQQAMQMAADTAVFEGNELGAYFTQQGYGFLRYDYRARQWRAFSDRALRHHTLPEHVALSLTLTGAPLPLADSAAEQSKPAIIFLSSGEMTAFRAQLSHRVHGGALAVSGDGLNPVQLQEARP